MVTDTTKHSEVVLYNKENSLFFDISLIFLRKAFFANSVVGVVDVFPPVLNKHKH